MNGVPQHWHMRVMVAAPEAHPTLAWPLAMLLAGRAGSDALLIAGDALAEAATEMALQGQVGTAMQLERLAGLLREEASERAGDGSV